MDLIKRNLFMIACVLVAAGGVALGITGMRAMPKVKTEMETAKSVHQNLNNLSTQPVNLARIEAEKQRIEQAREDHQRLIEKARTLYGWEPLVPNVLPYGTPTLRLEFKERYGQAMRALLASLTAGQPATEIDVRNMRDRIAAEEAALREHQINPLIPKPEIHTGPLRNAADMLTKAGVQKDPIARAHLQAAQRIYCYATGFVAENPNLGVYPSLEFDPIMANVETLDPPYPDEVWNAQLGYWIQKDVVDAIVALNEEAAKEAVERGEYGWVGNMPVKEVIGIRVLKSFVPAQGEHFFSPAVGGYNAVLPPGTPETVFTRNGSGESIDVVQFSVKLVMDERDILLFTEKLCNNRFYVPLRIAYTAAPINKTFVGKIYGPEPAVIVTMDFEIALLGEVFRRWMPRYTRDQFGVICRPQDECVEPPQ